MIVLKVNASTSKRRATFNERSLEQAESLASSIQTTYYLGIPMENHFNDMYSYRLAVINGFDYDGVEAALEMLKRGTSRKSLHS